MTSEAASPTGSRFDRASAVRPDEPAGGGRYRADVDPEWSVAGRPNGGYLLALAGRAALAELATRGERHPHVVAATAAYLSPAPFGAALLEVAELRRGRSTSVLRVRLTSPDGEPRVEALVTCGRLAADARAHHDGVPPVSLPELGRCARLPVQGPGFTVPLLGVVAEHLDPASLGWTTGEPSGAGELRGHLLFADGRPPDPLSLLLAVDAMPPASFDLGLTGWVPTLQLSAWVRAVPTAGALTFRQRARLVEDGLVDQTCDLWDARGRLVATGHQLAAVRLPRR